MTINYSAPGARRKELVQAISNITGEKPKYQAAPTFAYTVGIFTVTKDGTLAFPDGSDPEMIERVMNGLAKAGFESESAEEPIGLTVSVPLDSVSIGNLTNLLEAKGSLIQKALGIDSLPIIIEEDKVSFPWFDTMPDSDSAQAFTRFIAALCKMSREQKRISATAKEVENEKYAFRCFLLRLGFIGDEYKIDRKILLQNLSGSAAFKGGAKDADA